MHKIFIWIILATGALLAACGTGASSSSVPPASTGPTEVKITMTEFKIAVPQTTFKVGMPYRFVVSNQGTVNHDFSITPPTLSHSGMHMSVDEAHENAIAVIKAEDLPPGSTKSVNVTFSEAMSSSEIEFACHTSGHYESGMKTPFTVTQ